MWVTKRKLPNKRREWSTIRRHCQNSRHHCPNRWTKMDIAYIRGVTVLTWRSNQEMQESPEGTKEEIPNFVKLIRKFDVRPVLQTWVEILSRQTPQRPSCNKWSTKQSSKNYNFPFFKRCRNITLEQSTTNHNHLQIAPRITTLRSPATVLTW